MKIVRALAIAIILLAVMAPIAVAADTSGSDQYVYVSVSVNGELLVTAQPIAITADMSLDDVIKATHTAFYSGGESGYVAGIDPMWNMYLITKCWGVQNTPYVIYNNAPLGADMSIPTTVDALKVVANSNIIICTGTDTSIISPVSLTSTLSDDSVTVTATAWTLDFATFTYSSAPLAGANVIDPTTSASLGTTDANGSITVTVPESGVVAIEGMAAINVTVTPTAPPTGTAPPPEGAIAYQDAKNYIGQTVIIQDKVYEKVDAGDFWVLFLGGPSTDANAVGIEVAKSDVSKFPDDLYVGKTVIMTGELHENPVGGASFTLTDPSQIQVVSGAATAAPTSAAPASPEYPFIYEYSVILIVAGCVILIPIAIVIIVKAVRQSRLDKVTALPASPFVTPPTPVAAPASASATTVPKATSGSGTTVYVSVSVDGQLLVTAQPVTITDITVRGAIEAAHAAYYSAGKSGYTAGIDKTFNMFLITKCWGIQGTPYVILNGAPVGATATQTVDTTPVAANDNIIICISSDPMNRPAQPVSLTATLSGNSAMVTATAWTLNFSTFQYSAAPLANAKVIDPVTGKSLGATDANGSITVTFPESGIVAIGGLAAIMVTPKSSQSKGEHA